MRQYILDWHLALFSRFAQNPSAVSFLVVAVINGNLMFIVPALLACASDIAIIDALRLQSYLRQAADAEIALSLIGDCYNIVKLTGSALWRQFRISKPPLDNDELTVLLLAPKPNVSRFLSLKSYLQPQGRTSVVLLPRVEELSAIERFYVLHEISHLRESAHIQHYNCHLPYVRLAPQYFIYLAAAGNLWLMPLIFVFYWIDSKLEGDARHVEFEVDFEAWKLYRSQFGDKAAIEASVLVEKLFQKLESYSGRDRGYAVRAKLASWMRELLTLGLDMAPAGMSPLYRMKMNPAAVGRGILTIAVRVSAVVIISMSISPTDDACIRAFIASIIVMWAGVGARHVLASKAEEGARRLRLRLDRI